MALGQVLNLLISSQAKGIIATPSLAVRRIPSISSAEYRSLHHTGITRFSVLVPPAEALVTLCPWLGDLPWPLSFQGVLQISNEFK